MNWVFAPHDAAGDFDGAIGNDFIDVHVGLCAASRLPDHQREVFVKLSGNDFVAGSYDEIMFCLAQESQFIVRVCGGFLDDGQSANELWWKTMPANFEVFQGPLSLCPPVFVHGNLNGANAVGFRSEFRRVLIVGDLRFHDGYLHSIHGTHKKALDGLS